MNYSCKKTTTYWSWPWSITALVGLIMACSTPHPVDDLDFVPPTNLADEVYSGIFTSLDGDWKGSFYIFSDSIQHPGPVQPRDPGKISSYVSNLSPSQVIEVQQNYRSLTPFFQKVKITDRYVDQNGKHQIVQSNGVNKIHDGKIWCVVKKPGETIIHSGSNPATNALVWERSVAEPQAIEYFYETVSDSVYSILGWGYYGKDDLRKAPRYWFKANYHRLH